ncbi:uncharacterized protein ColSpa_11170 [Colletotrichum spaethianum]|uniref:Uncharacterized protein n=1 Tax=Colletotrichum spaethianum TaxID=700344 RepID=A0AA37PEZ8_9PEZI|nr:uncharacterized protein ColSpa_11170 [Colletotrichum spaethianum]GKT50989.1 hypothetical protein ColSpa_11170 [Colletotrichum spaethianum]
MHDIVRNEFTNNGHTVVMITHRLLSATENLRKNQDTIVLLSKGKIEKVGEFQDVLGIDKITV